MIFQDTLRDVFLLFLDFSTTCSVDCITDTHVLDWYLHMESDPIRIHNGVEIKNL